MNVLSLFDGICSGKVALDRANIKVDNYFASEIENNAIKIAKSNNADIIEIGNVCNIKFNNGILYTERGKYSIENIDLLIGGSPCTNFSSIGYANGMTANGSDISTLEQYLFLKDSGHKFEGESYLFWEYVRLLKEIKPKYFLLENVKMAKKWENLISENIGVTPIKINSSLLSAQNRPRLYWTNIPNVKVPKDKGITINDIIDKNADNKDVTYTQTVSKSLDKLQVKYGYIPVKFNAYNISEIKDKACALSKGSMITSSCATLMFIKTDNGVHTVKNGIMNNKYNVKLPDGKYNIRRLSFIEMERLQTLPDNYTNVSGVSDQKRSICIGNGWTVDVISEILKNIK